MNWRGRPLTSHQVIVSAIAATTTRTGLTVRAALDTSGYPLGTVVSDQQLARLPIDRHRWHCDWNYTFRPEPPAPAPPPPAARGPEHPEWAQPALTGMTAAAWDQLTGALEIPYQMQREIDLHHSRGGPRVRKPQFTGHPEALTVSEQALVTILRTRFQIPLTPLAQLFGTALGPISKAERRLRPLLAQAGHVPEPTGTRLATLPDLTAYAREHGIILIPKTKPAR